MKRGDIIYVHKDAIGNPRAARVRVEDVLRTREGRTEIYGVEVTKTGETRRYFGRRISEWRAWLADGDYDVLG